jgi:hypothetical protein
LASYDYGKAWRWAAALKRDERTKLWNQLLAMNGFASGCNAAR